MGADIHGFLEYRVGDRWFGVDDGWHPGRDYELFPLLANVRGQGALYPPRGMPRDAFDLVPHKYLTPVLETDADVEAFEWHTRDAAVTRRQAQESTAHGHAEWWDEAHRFISEPDWHTPSWLATAEFRAVVAHHDAQYPGRELDVVWRMLLGAMEAGEAY